MSRWPKKQVKKRKLKNPLRLVPVPVVKMIDLIWQMPLMYDVGKRHSQVNQSINLHFLSLLFIHAFFISYPQAQTNNKKKKKKGPFFFSNERIISRKAFELHSGTTFWGW